MYVCSYFEILPIKDMGRSNMSIKYRGCCFAASFTNFLDEFIIDLYINNSTNRKNTGINTLLGKVLIRECTIVVCSLYTRIKLPTPGVRIQIIYII